MLKASSYALAALLLVSTAACAVDIPDPAQSAPAGAAPTSAAPTLTEGGSEAPEVDPSNTPPSEAPTSSATPTLGKDGEGNPDDPAGNDNPALPTTTFDKTLTYSDGSTVKVTKLVERKLSARGVANDAKTGTPIVVITLKVTNGSSKEVEVTGSSASMTYGSNRKQATEAFELDFESMQGKIAPGKSKSGSYGFVVPRKERGNVQMEFTWDFYSIHKPALFTGELKTG
jgi:hypothetical protein